MSKRTPTGHPSAAHVAGFARASTLALAAALAAALATVLAAGCSPKPADTAAAAAGKPAAFHVTADQLKRLTIVTVAPTSFRPTLEATGTVAFNGDHSTQVISPISGPVARLMVSLGANVTVGQQLATVSSPDFAAAVATYRKAEAAASNTQRILKLDEQLFKNDALSRSELDQARTDASSSAADREAALLVLRALGLDEQTISAIRDGKQIAPVEAAIRANIPGTVVEKFINSGQLLQGGVTPAFTVADLATMWVFASVYATDVVHVQAGEMVEVLVDGASKPVSARVDYVAPIVDPGTKATTVRVVADNPSQLLKRDQFVRLLIHSTNARTGILVPASSVLRDFDNLPFVFVAAPDGSFLRRRVTLGYRVGNQYEITAGLAARDTVVAEGALFIQFAESQ